MSGSEAMMQERRLNLSGNEAVSYGVLLCAHPKRKKRLKVPAYPITPQTRVIEKLSEMADEHPDRLEYVALESEHSVGAFLAGAVQTGSEAMSASSGQGILYMAEAITWAVHARLPIKLAVPSRGPFSGWNIRADDTVVHCYLRDSGALISHASTSQEILDGVVFGAKVANEALLPHIGPNYGGFEDSHAVSPVTLHDEEEVADFLGDYRHPIYQGDFTAGGMQTPDTFYKVHRVKAENALEGAKGAIRELSREWNERFETKNWGMMKYHGHEKPETVMVSAANSIAQSAENAVDALNSSGERVGVASLYWVRPFPDEELAELAETAERLVVLDRATLSPLRRDVGSSLFEQGVSPRDVELYGTVLGLGGSNVSQEDLQHIFHLAERGELEFHYGVVA